MHNDSSTSWPPIEHLEIKQLLQAAGTQPSAEVVNMVQTDQRQRWQIGDHVPVEVYLHYLPALRTDETAVLRLLFWEASLREERGKAPPMEELVGRFPDFATEIRKQYSVEQMLRSGLQNRGSVTIEQRRTDPDINAELTLAVPPTERAAPVRAAVPGYEIISELGRGGMGVVYKARHLALNRLVALKMILSGNHAGTEELARFRNEAEAVARVPHPNLVQIYEVGEHEGRPYLALEFVDGKALDLRLREGNFEVREAARLAEILARAVHAVHQHGMVHRDLKPANILMTSSGVPKITDFGLAKRLDSQQGKTLTGDVLGTPMYMAPEQASGRIKDIGPATDIYSLGTILYEMLAGRPPFQANSGLDVVMMVTRDEPQPPSRIRHHLPRDLETICLKCLEKQPARRYTTAEELAEDLRRFQIGEPIKARPIGPAGRLVKWTRRHPAVASMVAVVLAAALTLLGIGIAYHLRLETALDEARAQGELSRRRLVRLNVAQGSKLLDEGDWYGSLVYFAEALRLDLGEPEREKMHRLRIGSVLLQCPEVRHMWFHDKAVNSACFSPDGKHALSASDDGTARIWDVVGGKAVGQPLEHAGPVIYAEFSRDNQWVVTASSDGTARIWEAATGKPRTAPLRHGKPLFHAAFNPAGTRVATCGQDNKALLWDAVTGAKLPIELEHYAPINTVAFSPDGKWIATASDDLTAGLWDAETGKSNNAVAHTQAVLWVAFRPDSQVFVTTSSDGMAQLWQTQSRDAVGLPLEHLRSVVYASFSADGKRVATSSDDHACRVWDATNGLPLSPPLKHRSDVNMAVFSPNGKWLASGGDDNTLRLWSLTRFEEVMPLFYHTGSVEAVAFSPDGLSVLSSGHGGTVRLFGPKTEHLRLLAKRESGEEKLQRTPSASQTIARSSDGKVLRANHDNTVSLLDAAGKRLLPLLVHGSKIVHVAFSPDEKRLLTCSDDNTARIWDAATGKLLAPPLKHHGTVVYAAFSADGRLVVTASRDETARVWDASTGEPITPPLVHAGEVGYAAIGADDLTVTTIDIDGRKYLWKLARDERPVEQIVQHAQLLAGNYLDGSRGYLPLQTGQLRELYAKAK